MLEMYFGNSNFQENMKKCLKNFWKLGKIVNNFYKILSKISSKLRECLVENLKNFLEIWKNFKCQLCVTETMVNLDKIYRNSL